MSLCLLSRQLINPLGFLCLEAGETQGEECPCHTVGACGCFSGGQVGWHGDVPSVSWLTTRVSPLWLGLPCPCPPLPTQTGKGSRLPGFFGYEDKPS